jgi:hypothetical protein
MLPETHDQLSFGGKTAFVFGGIILMVIFSYLLESILFRLETSSEIRSEIRLATRSMTREGTRSGIRLVARDQLQLDDDRNFPLREV